MEMEIIPEIILLMELIQEVMVVIMETTAATEIIPEMETGILQQIMVVTMETMETHPQIMVPMEAKTVVETKHCKAF